MEHPKIIIPKIIESEPMKPCDPPVFEDNVLKFIIATTYLVAGILYVTFGYRHIRSSLFGTTFTLIGGLIFILLVHENMFPHYGNHLISMCVGIAFGAMTLPLQIMGLFISGSVSGSCLGAAALITVSHISPRNPPTTYWITVLVMLFSGLVGGCANIYFKKGLTIISTSVYGGATILISLDYFVHRGDTIKWMFDRVKLEPAVAPPCSLSWLFLAVWPICVILGIIIQWTHTGSRIFHKQCLAAQKRRSTASQPHLTREQRAEMRQRKYRYLYQVRTAHGDVISQSYVQALQQKTSNLDPWHHGGECSTLQSDSTHLTVLAPDPAHPDSEEEPNRPCH